VLHVLSFLGWVVIAVLVAIAGGFFVALISGDWMWLFLWRTLLRVINKIKSWNDQRISK